MRIKGLLLCILFFLLPACGDDLGPGEDPDNQWSISGENQNSEEASEPDDPDDPEPNSNQNSSDPLPPPPVEDCPDEDADDVFYYSTDPAECTLVDPAQPWAPEFFNNECGCGYDGEPSPPQSGCDIDGCGDDEYCFFEDGQCGATGVEGVCMPLPEVCTDDIATVCGCDGQLYSGSSTCAAEWGGGVDTHFDLDYCDAPDCPDMNDPDVTYYGMNPTECAAIDFICEDGEEMFNNECGCGCIAVDDPPNGEPCDIDGCPDDQYCHYDDGVCGASGAQGYCQPKPTVCTDDMTTVCGCDGQIYYGSSSCAAEAEGVSSTSMSYCVDGECPDPDDEKVHYVSEDPLECAAIIFGCEEDQTMFNDECGCGCIDS